MKYSLLRRTRAALLSAGAALTLAAGLLAQAAPAPPPGYNVHLVREADGHRFWRGGGPKRETLKYLAKSAGIRGTTVTLIDLRHPPTKDDVSGRDGKLSPKAEAALAKELGLKYVAISALDKGLDARLQKALAEGDVYMHCMYGVNRTGFAAARYARSAKVETSRKGLGPRDWRQGDAFQARLERSR
ncbi:MAG: hypothetical protein ACK47B_26655 [Armatimonadota bacterium]